MTRDQLIISDLLLHYRHDAGFTDQLKMLHKLQTNSPALRKLVDAYYQLVFIGEGDIVAEFYKQDGTTSELAELMDDHDDMMLPAVVSNAIRNETNCTRVDELRDVMNDVRLGRVGWEDLRAAFFEMEVDERHVMSLAEIADSYDNREKRVYQSTGFHKLDRTFQGLCRRRVTILAARPGVGKTSICVQITINNLQRGAKVFWASLEMDEYELYNRLRNNSDVNKNWDLNVDSRPDLTVPQIAASANAEDYDLVIVDHIGKLKYTGKYHGTYEKTSAVMEQLRVAAKYSKAAWLVPCQLSRGVPDEHVRPKLVNLRDSGTIEEDAHAVLFLHEPLEKGENCRDIDAVTRIVELTVAKNRGARLGTQEFIFHMAASRWEEQ